MEQCEARLESNSNTTLQRTARSVVLPGRYLSKRKGDCEMEDRFQAQQDRVPTIDVEERILARNVRSLPREGLRMSIFLSSGRVMEFRYDKLGNVTAWSVDVPEPIEFGKVGTLVFEWSCIKL